MIWALLLLIGSLPAIFKVERWFAGLSDKAFRRGVHRCVRELITAIEEYMAVGNQRTRPFRWQKTATEIIDSIGRFCSRTLVAHLPGNTVSGH